MHRWIPRPQELMLPTTSMTNNFERERLDDPTSRWVFSDRTVPETQNVPTDHADLMVRYILELQSGRAIPLRVACAMIPRGRGRLYTLSRVRS